MPYSLSLSLSLGISLFLHRTRLGYFSTRPICKQFSYHIAHIFWRIATLQNYSWVPENFIYLCADYSIWAYLDCDFCHSWFLYGCKNWVGLYIDAKIDFASSHQKNPNLENCGKFHLPREPLFISCSYSNYICYVLKTFFFVWLWFISASDSVLWIINKLFMLLEWNSSDSVWCVSGCVAPETS